MKVPIRTQNSKKWSKAVEMEYKDEKHLQDTIFEDTYTIPFEDIDPESENRKKISIKEVGLPHSGSIDIVIIDETGEIYLIETKLANNDEIRRKVVGQILEYAAYLWKQDFVWLDGKVKEKLGSGLSELFQDVNGWKKEDFEEKVTYNLQEGAFKLIIVVDKVTDELRRITEFTGWKELAIYPIELRYFKDKFGTEVLVPKVFNVPLRMKATPRAKRVWDEETFFEDATNKVDEKTLSTIRKMYAFSKDLGEISWGRGAKTGTFRVNIVFRDKRINLYTIQSSGIRNWLNKIGLMNLGVDEMAVVEYIRHLKSLELDENKNWDSLNYPEFSISILNDDERFASFREATLKFKNLIARY